MSEMTEKAGKAAGLRPVPRRGQAPGPRKDFSGGNDSPTGRDKPPVCKRGALRKNNIKNGENTA